MAGLDEYRDQFWKRHENPKSGWSRVVTTPVILYAIYHRRWRLLVAALVFTAVNPVLFSSPETDDAWMTRVVRAERWWTETRGKGLLDLSYPNILNLANLLASLYALWAAVRRHPRGTAVAGVAVIGLKLWYVAELVQQYDDADPERG